MQVKEGANNDACSTLELREHHWHEAVQLKLSEWKDTLLCRLLR